MGSQQQRRGHRNQDPGAPWSTAPLVAEQPWGNAALAEQVGLSGPKGTAPSPASQALDPWSFGPEGDGLDSGLVAPAVGSDLGLAGVRDLMDFEGIDQELVAWFDLLVPPGLGVTGSVDLAAMFEVGLGISGGITLVNLGGGYWDLSVEGSIRSETAEALGVCAPDEAEAEAEMGGGVSVGGAFGFRVPWAKLAAGTRPATPTEVVGTVAASLSPERLAPCLMSVQVQVGVETHGEVVVGMLGQEVSDAIRLCGEASVSIAYDDLAAPDGTRTGQLRIGADVEGLMEVATTLGSGDLPRLHEATALIVPFQVNPEHEGTCEFGVPALEVGVEGEAGMVGAGASVELGPDHAALQAWVFVHPATVLWENVLRLACFLLPPGVELDAEGTVKLGVALSVDGVLSTLTNELWAWLTTGEVPAALAPHLPEVERIVARAQLTLAVDLVLAEATIGGEFVAGAGAKIDAELEGTAGLVFQSDDVLAELESPPTLDEALALLRSSAATLG